MKSKTVSTLREFVGKERENVFDIFNDDQREVFFSDKDVEKAYDYLLGSFNSDVIAIADLEIVLKAAYFTGLSLSGPYDVDQIPLCENYLKNKEHNLSEERKKYHG